MGPWRNRVCVFWESTRDLDLVREVFGLGCIPKPDHAHGFQEHLLEVRHRQPTYHLQEERRQHTSVPSNREHRA